MKGFIAALALLLFLALSLQAFSQSSNANLSGTITDATGGVLVGVNVTAANTATGIVSTVVSNNAGVYTFPSLLPGVYKISVEKTGFQVQTFKDVPLGNAAQVRLNCKLEVAGKEQTVEVNVAADRILLESSSSAGDVLSEKAVQDLPLVNSNALDLVRVIPGYIPVAGNAVFAANDTTVSGVSVANLNLQRDGVAISDVRQPAGIHSPTQINPDMVSEFRIITSPVDAEMGRGNSQVQVLTKSGTNSYHGAAVWDIQNSALDSNQWDNNRNSVIPPWRNLHQYTLSLGGPIVKNKTFFFALWNGQIARLRDSYTPLALTPCARKGIFRYFDAWNNGRYGQSTIVTGATPTAAVVDFYGNPVKPPAANPSMLNSDGSRKDNWQEHNGILRYASVFGVITNPTTLAPDCSNAVINTTATGVSGGGWDTYRKPIDTTGFKGDSSGLIDDFLSLMPDANRYDAVGVGDGLNTAGGRWTRGTRGADNMYGIGEDNQRKQINIKVDHLFNDRHRVSGSWSFEKNWADNNFKNWPGGWGGRTERQPQIITVNFTSTLTSTVFNEARFGLMRTGNNGYFPLENPETGAELKNHLPVVNGYSVGINPGVGGAAFNIGGSNYFGGRGNIGLGWTNHDISPRWTFADAIAWTRGKHMFKAGAEFRFVRSKSSVFGTGWNYNTTPIIVGGDAQGVEVQGINSTNMPGLTGTATTGNRMLMQNILSFLSGSIGSINQSYFINSPYKLDSWNDPLTEKEKVRDMHQLGMDFFFKDDFKVHENLTLNLGLRYEYYGVPFLNNGLTASLKGGPNAIYGISGRNWNEAFWAPGARADLTEMIFVGPNSPNPSMSIYSKDKNNFGPAVGFAWRLPWFGKGKTTMRGGYQISYVEPDNATTIEGIIGNPPGSTSNATYTPTTYLNFANMASAVPATASAKPMAAVPLTDQSQTITVYDPNFKTPYIQNLTLSITRNLGSNLTVDIRYIGTLSRKMVNNFNINTPNFLTNGLFEAFNAARYGDDTNPATRLLDQIFAPLRGSKSGAAYLRNPTGYTTARNMLANGNYSGLAQWISNFQQPGAPAGTTSRGYLLRTAGLAENFILSNPQFSTVNLRTNWAMANYHSMVAQVSMRPVAGFSFQTSYIWSKNLGNTGAAYTDPRNRAADYTLLGSDRPHVLTSYGTFDLPLGPNKLLFSKTSGFLAHLLENWQTSWVANVSSGNPVNITGQTMLYGTGVPDLAGNFPYDKIGTYWLPGSREGNYFAYSLKNADDPQRNKDGSRSGFGYVTTKDTLNTACTLTAAADTNGKIILQNALPGTRGNLGFNRIYGPATWNLDLSISKSVKIDESKKLSIRIDSTNVFNHPQPSGALNTASTRIYFASPPIVAINSTNPYLGTFATKIGQRVFQARIRFDF
jgi:hypothetical protein